ncbi:protein NRT1/ PTR FAMILY 4.6-like [Ananas comosus]|uniref:Protein NRT1/ PTR FAMILY 4.6-like n=1 Tax=Ananas comosus TaxID=4615 RepID=A0A6P5GPD5_ANACO|nr:protein NRT1/ PTR FAMILY 4.6-like [Ananas comosus]
MAIEDLVDWRGNPVDKKWHGGVRAACFLYFLVLVTNIANVANMLNLVAYLHSIMHTGVASSSTMVTNFIGAMSGFSLVGAIISDSYISRFKTMLIFGPLEFLGYGLLALQAHLPSLHPQSCDINAQSSNCEEVHGLNSTILYIAMYTIAFGEGCIRACLPSLGGDQFDGEDPVESRLKSSFFNWFTFGISLGGFIGLTLIVWIENNKGWDVGLGICCFLVLSGLIVVACGFPFYRNQVPKGSPLTRMLQVFVAAFRNRKLELSEKTEELPQIANKESDSIEVLPHTKGLKFLNKASINHGKGGAWSSCSATQVEETKIVLRMLPIFISSVIGYMPIASLLTFTIEQGSTMNTKLGKIHISPASLFVIPIIFQMAILVIYDRVIVPITRKLTGRVGGITHLQRIGIGFMSVLLATIVAALVERRRKKVAEENGLTDFGSGVPMSIFWLSIQFFFLGVADVTSFVGLLEFFNSEASRGMKSVGTAIFWCILGIASWFASFLVEVVNKATRDRERGRVGWLEGANLNKSYLDRFYWLLSLIGLLSFLNYLYWARRYVYRHNPSIVDAEKKSFP